MSFDGRDFREIGIWLLLLAFVCVAIAMPLLAVDAPDATIGLTFTLILILEILIVSFISPLLVVCAEYHFSIRLRSPPNR
jgi:hypothetical protein